MARTTVEAGPDGATVTDSGRGTIRTLEQLLAAADVDPDEWMVRSWTSNVWGHSDDERWQVKAHLDRLPAVLRLADPPVLRRTAPAPRREHEPHVTVAIPDTHFGYSVDFATGSLTPYHDEHAIDCALQIVAHVQPDRVVLLGDVLDLSQQSTRWPTPAAGEHTTHHAVRAARDFLADVRRACRSAEIDWCEGNHDRRMRDYVDTQARALATLRAPDGDPLVSVERVMGLDALDVRYVPASSDVQIGPVRYWHGDARERLEAGPVRRGGGATAAEMVRRASRPTAYGHVHRREYGGRTVEGRTIWAASPGCLCRTDGVVPGARPDEDWQQGLGVVTVHGDVATWEQVAIDDGRAYWRGRVWTSRVHVKADAA